MIRSPRSSMSRTYCSTSSASSAPSIIGSTRAGAPPCSGPESVPTADDMAAAQSAPVEAAMRAVNVDALRPCSAAEIQYVSSAFTCFGSASPRQRMRNFAAAFSPFAISSSGTGGCLPRAACATIVSVADESRARSSRACLSSMSTSFFIPHFGPSVARPACRSAGTEPLGSCSSIGSAGGAAS